MLFLAVTKPTFYFVPLHNDSVETGKRSNMFFRYKAITQRIHHFGAHNVWVHLKYGLAFGVGLNLLHPNVADNYSIAGVVGDPNAQKYLLQCLQDASVEANIDEFGLTTVSKTNKLETTKFGAKQDTCNQWLPDTFDSFVVLRNNAVSAGRHAQDSCGISVARTAGSHESKKAKYALQPQVDYKMRISLVHEGQLANGGKLRGELKDLGVNRSNSDAELIVELVAHYMDKGFSVPEALKQGISRLDGSWAIALLDRENPDELIVAQNGSRLAIGIGKGKMYVATDPSAFAGYTDQFVALQDGEFGIVKANGSTFNLSKTEQLPLTSRTTHDVEKSPAPFEHWTLNEIFEQPEALLRTLGCGMRIAGDMVVLGGFDKQAEKLLAIESLTLAGQSSSLHAAQFGAILMNELGSFNTVRVLESQDVHTESISREGGGFCLLSRTGENKVSQVALKRAKLSGSPVFSLVNAVGSQVAKITKLGAYLNAGEEHGNIATKVFTSQIALMALVASWFAQYRDDAPTKVRVDLINSLQRLPQCISSALECRSQCKVVAQRLFEARHCFVVGKTLAEPIAKEGAALLSMLGQINAEGCSLGGMLHGSMSLIQPSSKTQDRTPVIVVLLKDDSPEVMRSLVQQLRSCGAFTIVITDDESYVESVADAVIPIPHNGMLTAVNAIVPLQLLAYELALSKGINPDTGL